MEGVRSSAQRQSNFANIVSGIVNGANLTLWAVEDLNNAVDMWMDTVSIAASMDFVDQDTDEAAVFDEALKNSPVIVAGFSPNRETVPAAWNNNLTLFEETGGERFEQEIQSINILNISGDTKNPIGTADLQTNIVSVNAANDLRNIQQHLQSVQLTEHDQISCDFADVEQETLLTQLSQTLQNQPEPAADHSVKLQSSFSGMLQNLVEAASSDMAIIGGVSFVQSIAEVFDLQHISVPADIAEIKPLFAVNSLQVISDKDSIADLSDTDAVTVITDRLRNYVFAAENSVSSAETAAVLNYAEGTVSVVSDLMTEKSFEFSDTGQFVWSGTAMETFADHCLERLGAFDFIKEKIVISSEQYREFQNFIEARNKESSTFEYKDTEAVQSFGEIIRNGEYNTFSALADSVRTDAVHHGVYSSAMENFELISRYDSFLQMPGEDLNGGDIYGNIDYIPDAAENSGEDLKYLRDIAEQEAINRFTTAEIRIEQNNNNNIASNLDLDGVMEGLTDAVNEAAVIIAEGVHV